MGIASGAAGAVGERGHLGRTGRSCRTRPGVGGWCWRCCCGWWGGIANTASCCTFAV